MYGAATTKLKEALIKSTDYSVPSATADGTEYPLDQRFLKHIGHSFEHFWDLELSAISTTNFKVSNFGYAHWAN